MLQSGRNGTHNGTEKSSGQGDFQEASGGVLTEETARRAFPGSPGQDGLGLAATGSAPHCHHRHAHAQSGV